MLESVVADEDYGVETLEDHADLCSGIPAVVTSCWRVGTLKAVTSSFAHGLQKCCSVAAIESVF